MAATKLVLWAVPLSIFAVISFGVLALVLATLRQRKHGQDTPEFFLTARGTIKTMTIAWSFYAAAMGSWALFAPPSFFLFGGVVGSAVYAFSAAFPIVIVAFLGSYIHRLVPDVISISDFSRKRFGPIVQLYVTFLMLFNMGIALTAEYTTMGDLFEIVIGWQRLPMVLIVGITATLYTSWGGLYVSIITDQWQAILSVLIILAMAIYLGATFRPGKLFTLEQASDAYEKIRGYRTDFGPQNYNGLASIAYLPLGLFTATIFSEAMWQRCWASYNKSSLIVGSIIGSMMTFVAVSFFSLGGILAVLSDVWRPVDENDFGNTILFSLFNKTYIIVIIAILSVTMSESAVDSLQNAVVDCVAGTFIQPYFPKINILWVRVLVLVLNIPPIWVSLRGYSVIQLFLFANLITTTSAGPFLLGLWWRSPISQKIVTPFSMLLGCAMGFTSILIYALIRQVDGVTYRSTLHNVFFVNFDWPPFLLALGFSFVGLALGALLEYIFRAVTRLKYRRVEFGHGNPKITANNAPPRSPRKPLHQEVFV